MTNKDKPVNLTKSEEDYLKALLSLEIEEGSSKIGNNQLAAFLHLSPASVNNMVKKLKAKKLIKNEKYSKLELSDSGRSNATNLIRKHRLWETFLCKYLNFNWHEVHEVAEQLEHVKSEKLIQELDRFMDFPKSDPHGDSIPSEDGLFIKKSKLKLNELSINDKCKLISVKDSSVSFLKYITEIGLALSSEIKIKDIREFDQSIVIEFNNKTETVSHKFAEHVFIERI